MSVLQTIPLSQDAIKVRWKEPYVSSALNQKSLAFLPKGVVTGFTVMPQSPLAVGVTVALDASGIAIANVRETTGGLYSVTLILNAAVNISLTAGVTCFITLDAQYVVGGTSTAQLKVVDAAELLINPDLVLLAKVNVPGVGNVVASHINMGYRDSSGDSTPTEASMHFNLIHNPTFEATAAGWTNSGFDSVTASTDFAHSGGYSLKLVKSPAGSVFVTTGSMPVGPARAYKVGAWMHSPAGLVGGNGGKLQVGWYDAAGAQIGGWVDIEAAISVATASFVERKAEVLAPTLALTAVARVYFDSCAGTLYVDDVFFASHTHDEVMKSAVFGGPGVSGDAFHTHTGAGLAYGGGVNWADGVTNPATTVEAQIDKILSDLAGSSGAPKVGNCPSKILTNTFTQLNTFSNGISVGAGATITSGNLGLTLGNITFALGSQQIVWPSGVLIASPNAGALSLAVTGGLGGQALLKNYISGNHRTELAITEDASGGNLSLIIAEDHSEVTDIVNGLPIDVGPNSDWRFQSDGRLTKNGAAAKITNVANPTVAQDVATKNYVDTQPKVSIENGAHNGNFQFWQRTNAAVSQSRTPIGLSVRAKAPDRWSAVVRVDAASGGGTNTVQIQPVGSGLAHSPTACRMTLTATRAGGFGFLFLVHDLDRDFCRRARGQPLTISFKWARGGSWGSAAGIVEVIQSNGDGWRNYSNYNGVNTSILSNFIGQGSIPVSLGTVTTVVTSAVAADTNAIAVTFGREWAAGVTGGTLDLTDVIIQIGDQSASVASLPAQYPYAGGSWAGELDILQQFFEVSGYLLGGYQATTPFGISGFPYNSTYPQPFPSGPSWYGLTHGPVFSSQYICTVPFLSRKRLPTELTYAADQPRFDVGYAGVTGQVLDTALSGTVSANTALMGFNEHEFLVYAQTSSALRQIAFNWYVDADY